MAKTKPVPDDAVDTTMRELGDPRINAIDAAKRLISESPNEAARLLASIGQQREQRRQPPHVTDERILGVLLCDGWHTVADPDRAVAFRGWLGWTEVDDEGGRVRMTVALDAVLGLKCDAERIQ